MFVVACICVCIKFITKKKVFVFVSMNTRHRYLVGVACLEVMSNMERKKMDSRGVENLRLVFIDSMSFELRVGLVEGWREV